MDHRNISLSSASAFLSNSSCVSTSQSIARTYISLMSLGRSSHGMNPRRQGQGAPFPHKVVSPASPLDGLGQGGFRDAQFLRFHAPACQAQILHLVVPLSTT